MIECANDVEIDARRELREGVRIVGQNRDQIEGGDMNDDRGAHQRPLHREFAKSWGSKTAAYVTPQ